MAFMTVGKNKNIVLAQAEGLILTDPSSALDLIASARYETDCDRLILEKSAICEDFFRLSSGLAGEILQKFVNYRMKLAIVGDFSGYTSKPLKDFMTESNRGRDFFFVGTLDEALARLED